MIQIEKKDLIEANWKHIFQQFNNSTQKISNFMQIIGASYAIYNDLDNTLQDLGRKCKSHIKFYPSKKRIDAI